MIAMRVFILRLISARSFHLMSSTIAWKLYEFISLLVHPPPPHIDPHKHRWEDFSFKSALTNVILFSSAPYLSMISFILSSYTFIILNSTLTNKIDLKDGMDKHFSLGFFSNRSQMCGKKEEEKVREGKSSHVKRYMCVCVWYTHTCCLRNQL